MATTARIDKVTLLEANERHGALRRLVRLVEVSGIQSTSWALLTEALDDAGVPQYGARLTEDSANNASDLVLVERIPMIVDSDKVKIELVYENFADLEQDLTNPHTGIVIGEVKCNISQKTSNLDIDGNPITVTHTYPAEDQNHGGETLTQGGEIQYYEPQRSIIIQGIKVTNTHWLITDRIVGFVNEEAWSGGAARTWMCTACTWKLSWLGASGARHRYSMNFEFQHDLDTWDPTVTFIDDVTNKPPAGLVVDVGYKQVTKVRATDFERVLGVWLQGG